MRFHLGAKGPFSLAAAIGFLRGFTPASYDGADDERLVRAFVAEDGWVPTAIEVRAAGGGVDVHCIGPCRAGLPDQVARMLSLDVDGREFAAVGERDPVIGALQKRYPGLRPVCFPSPYEAAVWGILSQRVRMAQAAELKRRIARDHGEAFGSDDTATSFPPPSTLLALSAVSGVSGTKMARLHCVARAAEDGVLDGAHLRRLPADRALSELRELDGVGPFTAELILLRGAGAPDVLPTAEKRLRLAVDQAYGPGTRLEDVATSWAPFRSWCAVLLRTWFEEGTGEL